MSIFTRTKDAAPADALKGGDDEVRRLLKSIDRRLALLTAADERDLRTKLVTEVLRAGGRLALWNAVNGQRNSQDLAKAAGVSERFAQLFVNELVDLGLARRVERSSGRGTVVMKDELGAVDWYVRRAENAESAE